MGSHLRKTKHLPLNIGIFLLAFSVSAHAAPLTTGSNSVKQTKKTNHAHVESRLLLICAPSQSHVYVKSQLDILQSQHQALEERELTILPRTDDITKRESATTTLIKSTYHIKSYKFTLVLIDKDGNEVLRAHKPVTAKTLIKTIDALPRRQAELRWINSFSSRP